MSQLLADFVPEEQAGPAAHLFADRPTIHILLYTDDPTEVKDNPTSDFGVGLMKKFLNAHQPTFAKIEPPELVSRNTSKKPEDHAAQKLDQLLPDSNYDQVWFFGIHLSNLSKFTWDSTDKSERGGRFSELTDEEVVYLRDVWMKTGGVLVTGDHSEDRSKKATPQTLPKALSLGRALGHGVPRAGQMRRWEEGPGNDKYSSFNTQEPYRGGDLNGQKLERDEKPQNIILVRLNDKGEPKPDGKPHFLFKGRDGGEIDVFPDHMHEGEVRILKQLDDWPTLGPEPQVVSIGTDKRNGRTYNLVAVYNGDPAGVGRVVVDSTWHHYFNMNLTKFAENMGPGSAADLIGQYYGNLAVWLAPLLKRQQMGQAMFWWIVNHPRVSEETSGGPLVIGRIARQVLAQIASGNEINELLVAYTPENLLAEFPMLRYPESSSASSRFPSQELIIGAVIEQYRQEVATVLDEELLAAKGRRDVSAVIREGFKQAFLIHAEMSVDRAAEARASCAHFK